jgi:hypothetical protein
MQETEEPVPGEVPDPHIQISPESMKQRLTLVTAILIAPMAIMQLAAAPSPSPAPPLEIILVEGEMVTSAAMSQWKKEGFQAVAVLLDERIGEAAYREVGRRISDGGLDLYCWIEVARNPTLAAAHPAGWLRWEHETGEEISEIAGAWRQ